jgi:predicted nucleic acid-binding protein
MAVSKIIVHTDIVIDYLTHDGDTDSILRRAMGRYFCYTTVFNAIELFSLAANAKERDAVERSLSAMKILGLNAKRAKQYGDWCFRGKTLPRMNFLIACMAIDSKLPILTGLHKEFKGMKGLTLLHPKSM